ncbi:MAG: Holliday junction branch migration protein RuvA, partial [Gammaproteobacteria bacterium]
MIGQLRGKLLGKRPPQLLLDVHGVGYEIEAPMTTFYDLPAVGEEIMLYTHLAVRDDAHTLYGFVRLSDRDLFRNLLRVN